MSWPLAFTIVMVMLGLFGLIAFVSWCEMKAMIACEGQSGEDSKA